NRNVRVLKNIYNQIPNPKAVVAVGACACTGGIFKECYNVIGGVDKIIPVDVYVPGCCPRPEAIIDGIVMAVTKMNEAVESGSYKLRELVGMPEEPEGDSAEASDADGNKTDGNKADGNKADGNKDIADDAAGKNSNGNDAEIKKEKEKVGGGT
ncbi:MAG: hypothetical protein HGA22_10445, partial [Clostridiales bacterium]|nr:hypothetical protein [Clostridiales bacterium]